VVSALLVQFPQRTPIWAPSHSVLIENTHFHQDSVEQHLDGRPHLSDDGFHWMRNATWIASFRVGDSSGNSADQIADVVLLDHGLLSVDS